MATRTTTKADVKESKIITPANVLADTAKTVAAKADTKDKKETAAEKTVKTEAPAKTAAAVKKTAEKKAPAKKAAAKKEIKVKAFVQYMGKEVEEKEMVAAVKKAWTKASGKKVADIKSIDLYIKPEEGAVYYVVNGTDTGSVAY